MEKELIFGRMVLNILVIFKMIIDTDMDKCIGKMEEFIKENG